MRCAGMEKLQVTLCLTNGILVLLSFNLLWITGGSASSEYQNSKEMEATVEFPLLTPTSNTEPFHSSYIVSNEVTSEAAAGEIYDQISPSRDPTTPISRNFLDVPRNYQERIRNPSSTIPTMLNAPPPLFYHSS